MQFLKSQISQLLKSRTGTASALMLALLVFIGAFLGVGFPVGHGSPVRRVASPRAFFNQTLDPPDVPAEALIGEDFTFKVRFQNTSVPNDFGYAPFIDLALKTRGEDDNQTNPPLGTVVGDCDGVNYVSAKMVDVTWNQSLTPKYATGSNPTFNCMTTMPVAKTHPLGVSFGSIVAPDKGWQVTTLELPFGSYDRTEPDIVVEVTAHISKLADEGKPLTICARGGFRGSDPLLTTPDLQYGTTWTIDALDQEQCQTVIPRVLIIKKKYLGPEDETASGANFPHNYQITVDIADGQKVDNLVVEDLLSDRMQFNSVVSVVAPCNYTVPHQPPVGTPGDFLAVRFPCVMTGIPGVEDTIVFEFHVPEVDAKGVPILNEKTCASVTADNNLHVRGEWTPEDVRDIPPVWIDQTVSPAHTLNIRCMAIQKYVSPPTAPIPGNHLTYTLEFQVSDFYQIGNIVVTDILADGQTFIDGTARLTIGDKAHTTVVGVPFTAATLSAVKTQGVSCQVLPTDPTVVTGGTLMTFQVTSVIPGLTFLTGGYASSATSWTTPAKGTITFDVTVDDKFTFPKDTPPPMRGDIFVDKHDPINNCVQISGTFAHGSTDPAKKTGPTLPTPLAVDNSATQLHIAHDSLFKEIVAKNGQTYFPGDRFAAGDQITYKIDYRSLPSSDAESLYIQDWLPMPVLPGALLTWVSGPCTTPYPASGFVCWEPGTLPNLGSGFPKVTLENGNSVKFYFGSFNDPGNAPRHITIYYTLTVSNAPFADLLHLTNVAQECEENSFSGATGKKFCQTAITEFVLSEPAVHILKGVVLPSSALFDSPPAGSPSFNFNKSGSSCPTWPGGPPFTGFNSNITGGVDAGDKVTFVLLVENYGSGTYGAFDVVVNDVLPPDFSYVVGSGCVQYGNSALLGFGGGPTPPLPYPFAPSTGFPITLSDDPPGTSPALGALASNPSGQSPSSNPLSYAVITFQAQLSDTIKPGCYTNKASVDHYAATEQGQNFVPNFGDRLTDVAKVCITPTLTKSILYTSEKHTLDSPDPRPLAIGEIVRYRLQIQLPEGFSPGLTITDLLPPGLTYLKDGTTTVGWVGPNGAIKGGVFGTNGSIAHIGSSLSNLAPSNATNILPGSGQFVCGGVSDDPSFLLGDVTHPPTSANTPGYIILELNALVCNTDKNNDTDLKPNAFQMTVKGGAQPWMSDSASAVIVEPKFTMTKTASSQTVMQGGEVTYTVTFENTGHADAFNVMLSDPQISGSTPVPTNSGCVVVPGVLSCDVVRVGQQVTLVYKVRAQGECRSELLNTAKLIWTSLPGKQGTLSNPTGSFTPGQPGQDNGERTDADYPGGPDDYALEASASVTITCPPSVCVQKFNDLNGNGIWDETGQHPEPGLGGFTFQIQLNGAVVGEITTSDEKEGFACFPTLPSAGTYTVIELAHEGWSPTTAAVQTVSISTDQTEILYFGNKVDTVCDTACTNPAGGAKPPDGMVSWWRFEEATGSTVADFWGTNPGTTKSSTGATAGINSGGGPWHVAGQYVGNSMLFVGSYVEVPPSADLKFATGPLSIDAWVKVQTNFTGATVNSIQPIVDKIRQLTPAEILSGVNAPGYALYVWHPAGSTTGQLAFVIEDGTTTIAPVIDPSPLTGGWHHVAVTVARPPSGQAEVTFYVDGVATSTSPHTVTVGSPGNNMSLWIGKSRIQSLLNAGFRADSLDELEIFNAVVPAAAIKAIFLADTTGKCREKTTPKPDSMSDLGDAPDSSNHRSMLDHTGMLAYPGDPVRGSQQAKFPTVYAFFAGPVQGPLHLNASGDAWLGHRVTFEKEADQGWDQDVSSGNNIQPLLGMALSVADKDEADDGVIKSNIILPSPGNCISTKFDYTVTVVGGPVNRYVNVWFDFNQDGDWDDLNPGIIGCPGVAGPASVKEWAVQNQTFYHGPVSSFPISTPNFLAFRPLNGAKKMWMRITLTDVPVAAINGLDGSGPALGYEYGETEDYLLDLSQLLDTATVCVQKFNDLNGNGVQDGAAAGESLLSGWTFTLIGTAVTTPVSDTTHPPTRTCFTVRAPQIVTVTETQKPGWLPTVPASGSLTRSVLPGQTYNLVFGNKPAPSCDLRITKTVKPSPLAAGQQGTATITVTNVGSAPCMGPTSVTEALPSGLTLVSANGSGWACNGLVCSYPAPIPVNGTLTLTYTFTVKGKPGTMAQNCVYVSNPNDTNAGNNRDCVDTPVVNPAPVGSCDLRITKTVSPSPLVNGQPATATITVTNVGTAPCMGPTQVTETAPSGTSLVSATGSGWVCNGPICTYAAPIPINGSLSLTYKFNVTAKPGTVVNNCVELRTPTDTIPRNDRVCVVTPVVNGGGIDSVWVHKRVLSPAGMQPPTGPFSVQVSCTPSGPNTTVSLTSGNLYRAGVVGPAGMNCTFTESVAAMAAPPPGCTWLAPSYPNGQTGRVGQTVEIVNTIRCESRVDSVWIHKTVSGWPATSPMPTGQFPVQVNCTPSLPNPMVSVAAAYRRGVWVPAGTSCTVTELPLTYPDGSAAVAAPPGCGWLDPSYPNGQAAQAGQTVEIVNTVRCASPRRDSIQVFKTVNGAPYGVQAPTGPFSVQVTCTAGGPYPTLALTRAQSATVVGPSGMSCTFTEQTAALPAPPAGCTWLAPSYPYGQTVRTGQTMQIVNTLRCGPTWDTVWVHKTVVAPPGIQPPTGPFTVQVSCTPSVQPSAVSLTSQNQYRGGMTGPAGLTCTFTESPATMPVPPQNCAWLPATYPNRQAGRGGQTVEIVNTLRCGTVQPVVPDLLVSSTVRGTPTSGRPSTYILEVRNAGAGPTTGPSTLTDALPGDSARVSTAGTPWSCTVSGRALTCQNPRPIAPAQVSQILVTVLIAGRPGTAVTNCATVATVGDGNRGNDRQCGTDTIRP